MELNQVIGYLMLEGLDYAEAIDFILECSDYEAGLLYEEVLNEVSGTGGRVDPFTGVYTGRSGVGSHTNAKKYKGTSSKMSSPPAMKSAMKAIQLGLKADNDKYSPEERKKFRRRSNKIARWNSSLDTNAGEMYGRMGYSD